MGVAVGGVALSVVTYVLGVATTFIFHHCASCKADQPTATTSLELSEHVQVGQGDPMYEDILPQGEKKDTVIELETNVAYDTANRK